jgi:hypothetical protein
MKKQKFYEFTVTLVKNYFIRQERKSKEIQHDLILNLYTKFTI